MAHASKVFISGNSQAVRIPKEYQISEKELYIQKVGNTLFLFLKMSLGKLLKKSLNEFSDDFMSDGRSQPEKSN